MTINTNGTPWGTSPPTVLPSRKRPHPTEIRINAEKSLTYFRKVSANDARLWKNTAHIEVLAKNSTLAPPYATAERCLELAYRCSVLNSNSQEITELLPSAIANLKPVQRGRLIKVFHFLHGEAGLAVKKTLYVHLYHNAGEFPGVSIQDGYRMKLEFADKLLSLPNETLTALELPGLQKISFGKQSQILEEWKSSLNCCQLSLLEDQPVEVMPNKYFPGWGEDKQIFLDAPPSTEETSIAYSRLIEGLNAKSVTFQQGEERREELVELLADHLPDVDKDKNNRPFFNSVNVVSEDDLNQPYIEELIAHHEAYYEALAESRLSKRQKKAGNYSVHSHVHHRIMELDLFINKLLFPGVPAHWPAPTTPIQEPIESLLDWLKLKITETSEKSHKLGKQADED